MGQYWTCVNLDKKEYIHPHRLGCGLKLCEQLANHPSTGTALIILCAAMPEVRGGGDLDLDSNWHGPERYDAMKAGTLDGCTPAPMPEGYQDIAHRTIGRWAGDRIAFVGDYAEQGDLPRKTDHADLIYTLCSTEEEKQEAVAYLGKRAAEYREGVKTLIDKVAITRNKERAAQCDKEAKQLMGLSVYTDITDDVCAVIEHELGGKFEGSGWREWKEGK